MDLEMYSQQCKTLGDNPIFSEVVAQVEQRIINGFRAATTDEEVLKLKQDYKALEAILAELIQGMQAYELELLQEQSANEYL